MNEPFICNLLKKGDREKYGMGIFVISLFCVNFSSKYVHLSLLLKEQKTVISQNRFQTFRLPANMPLPVCPSIVGGFAL